MIIIIIIILIKKKSVSLIIFHIYSYIRDIYKNWKPKILKKKNKPNKCLMRVFKEKTAHHSFSCVYALVPLKSHSLDSCRITLKLLLNYLFKCLKSNLFMCLCVCLCVCVGGRVKNESSYNPILHLGTKKEEKLGRCQKNCCCCCWSGLVDYCFWNIY